MSRHIFTKLILTSLEKPQIDSDSHLIDDKLNDCPMTINGTYFCIQQRGITKKGNIYGSHKYAGKSMLRYELGIDILKGNLVWVEVQDLLELPHRPPPAGGMHQG